MEVMMAEAIGFVSAQPHGICVQGEWDTELCSEGEVRESECGEAWMSSNRVGKGSFIGATSGRRECVRALTPTLAPKRRLTMPLRKPIAVVVIRVGDEVAGEWRL
jgi:hypothetical protein